MKRVVSLFLTMVLLVSCMVPAVYAIEHGQAVVNAPAMVERGREVTVSYKLPSTVTTVVYMQFFVKFDSDAFAYKAAVAEGWDVLPAGAGLLGCMYAAEDMFNGDNLADKTLEFTFTSETTATPGNYAFEFEVDWENGNAYDVNDEDIAIEKATAIVEMTLPAVPATAVTLPATLELTAGGTQTLTPEVTPAGTTDVPVWSSSNEAVATVDQTGKVTGVGEGTATITVKYNDSVKATCTVKVEKAPCAHTSKTLVAEQASTCKVPGWDAYFECVCSQLFDKNGAQISAIPYREINSDNHVSTTVFEAVIGDCLHPGHEAYTKCNDCGKVTAGSDTPVDGPHGEYKNTETNLASKAACGKNAFYYKTCSICGEPGNETWEKPGTALQHTTEGGSTATCLNKPVCGLCGEPFGTTVDHKYIEKVANEYVKKPAACGEPAIYWKSCEWCGEASATESFTYGTPGEHIYTGEVVKDEALAAGATCTEAAKYWKSCSCGAIGVNGETFTVGEPLGHKGGTATCTAQAICERCTQPYGDKLPHSMTHHDAVAADCKTETNGNVEYWACSTCGKNYADELGTSAIANIVVAWAHTWDAGVVTTEPTKEAEGVKTYTCTVCGDTKTEPIAKLPSAVITPVGPSKDKDEENGEVELTMSFADVTAADWFYDTIKYTYENGLMNGVSENNFAPYANTSRAMLVTILWRLEGEPAPLGSCQFVDVPAGAWYTEAVTWAAEKGIVTGLTATEFGPDANITREQFATILYRYAKNYKGYDVSVGEDTNILSYTDAMTVSEYAIPAMQWACGAGLINGIDGALQPAGFANRAQAATILARFCQNYQ